MAKKSPSAPKAARKGSADTKAVFDALVSEKIAAGLSRSDAEFCARQQIAHDVALAGDSPADEDAGGEDAGSQAAEENPPAQ